VEAKILKGSVFERATGLELWRSCMIDGKKSEMSYKKKL